MARDANLRREPVLRASEPVTLRGGEPAPRGAPEPLMRNLLVTTTSTVEGRTVEAYLGLVTGEVLASADILQDTPPPKGLIARLRGRAPAGGEGSLSATRETALRDMKSRAAARGADAVLGVTLATQLLGDSLVVTATGTAVKLGGPVGVAESRARRSVHATCHALEGPNAVTRSGGPLREMEGPSGGGERTDARDQEPSRGA